VTAPFDYDALWHKSVLFINRSNQASDFEEQALWAFLALEMLAKAALAKVNPCLIADPSDDGKSLLIAAGLSRDYAGFKTVAAKTVFSRCARAFPPFDQREADRIAQNRNEDLHSGGLPFAGVREDTWWQRFWGQAVLLLSAQGRDLADLVGVDRVAAVEAVLAANERALKHRVDALVQRATQRLALVAAGSANAKVLAELEDARRLTLGAEFRDLAPCPACDTGAYVYGDYESDSEIDYDGEWPIEVATISTDSFGCPTCGLAIEGPEFISALGLPTSFQIERDYLPDYGDYQNE
jgi:hypothetical protein